MGNINDKSASSYFNKVNFEDIIDYHKTSNNDNNIMLINTLNSNEQNCLIKKTINCNKEETIINKCLNSNKNIHIIIYGKNMNDEKMYEKGDQLLKLGFTNVYLYLGGLFEWLCLQDIYGNDTFKTTSKELDILKYKPIKENICINAANNKKLSILW